jgi:4-hydroxy-tetrahydrodipicolinate reductase
MPGVCDGGRSACHALRCVRRLHEVGRRKGQHPDGAGAGRACRCRHVGLSADDYAEIASAAERRQRGVLAVGNFAITVVLLQKFAEIAARYIPQWEIIDYASDGKPDALSGTVWELATRLGTIAHTELTVPLEETQGIPETRGARVNGVQVHALRLPGYVISAEVVFGMPDQRLTLPHDAGRSPAPYVGGALLAIRKVSGFTGLRRGLDTVMDLD